MSVRVRPLGRAAIDGFKHFAGGAEVLHVFVLSGDDDFLLHVAVQDLDHLHAFLVDRLGKRPEVTGFRSSMIFQQVSNTAPRPALRPEPGPPLTAHRPPTGPA